MDLIELKASIRAVLLSLGKTATEQEFRKAFYEQEVKSFNEVLREFKINFYDLFSKMPDVAKVVYANNMVFIQRVSNQETTHMDKLTVNKYSKKYRGPKLVAKSGALKIPVRPFRTNPYLNSKPSYNRYNSKTSQPNVNIRVSVGSNGTSRSSQFVKSYGNNSSVSNSSKYGSSGAVLKPYYPNTNYFKNQSASSNSSHYGSNQNNYSAPKAPVNYQIKSSYQQTSVCAQKEENSARKVDHNITMTNKSSNDTTDWDDTISTSKISPIKYPEVAVSNLKKENVMTKDEQSNGLIDWDSVSCATSNASSSSVSTLKNVNSTSTSRYVENIQNNFAALKKSKISPSSVEIDDWDDWSNSATPKLSKNSPIRYPGMFVSSLKKDDWDSTTPKQPIKAHSNYTSPSSYFSAPNKSIIGVKEDQKVTPARPKPVASSSKIIPPNVLKDKNMSSVPENPIESIINKIEVLKLEDFEQKKMCHEKEIINHKETQVVSQSNKENSRSLSILNSEIAKDRMRCLRSIKNILNENKAKDNSKKASCESAFSKVINSMVELPPIKFDENNRLFEIKILDVFSPSKFTFQFLLDNLSELNKKMNQFYNNMQNIENYKLDELAVKNIVAIRNNNSWYRGQIISIDSSGVYVQYVDSLKIDPVRVSPQNIFHLHKNFSTEPPHSAFGRIHGLKSNDDANWNFISASKMIDYQEKDVWAIFKCMNENAVCALSIAVELGDFKRMIDVLTKDNIAEINPCDFIDGLEFQLSSQD